MGWVRGNPRALFVLFFSFAIFLTGSIYSTWQAAMRAGLGEALIVLAQVAALSFVLLILGRILWVTAGRSSPGCLRRADGDAERPP